MQKENRLKIHLYSLDINLSRLIYDIDLAIHYGENPVCYIKWDLAEMSKIVTGSKINKYREVISAKLHQLSDEQKQKVIDMIVLNISERENMSFFKRLGRIQHISEQKHREIVDKRKEMWRDRVKKLWNL